MKNAFYFTLNFEMYDVTAWLTKNYNKHIAQYLTN